MAFPVLDKFGTYTVDSDLAGQGNWLGDSGPQPHADGSALSANSLRNIVFGQDCDVYVSDQDGNNGDCLAWVKFRLLTATSGNILTVANRATPLVGAQPLQSGTYYGAIADIGNGGRVYLYYRLSGAFHFINSSNVVAVTWQTGVRYRLTLLTVGTSIKGELFRESDSNYLRSDATWQLAQTYFETEVDSHVTGQGKAGMLNTEAADDFRVDEFKFALPTSSSSSSSSSKSSTSPGVSGARIFQSAIISGIL